MAESLRVDGRDGAGIDAVAGRERREIEPDHLRVRGVGVKTLAAAPAANRRQSEA